MQGDELCSIQTCRFDFEFNFANHRIFKDKSSLNRMAADHLWKNCSLNNSQRRAELYLYELAEYMYVIQI